MSTPSTPTPNPTTVSVTPGTALGTNLPGDPPRFEDETLSLIVNLIAPGSSEAVTPVLNELFAIRWQVMTWSDLVVFNSADVINALQPGTGISVELTAPVVAKKLGYIVDYARIGKLTPTLTMNEIVISVNTAHRQKMSPTSLPNSPSHRMVQIFDKKAVPTLEKFSGSDEDFLLGGNPQLMY
ncbi:hypothetical protein MHU86_5898 [Fragilaria crotonensis]|nr:hypothetical protein MHU86_5898 [Fragilaria crotonensis]